MNGVDIFIKLYLDEDVDVLVADLLKARGFSATTTREAGNLGLSDHGQLKFAKDKGMTLLTHNRADFEELARTYDDSGMSHPGIILAVRRPPREIVRRLLVILNHITADEMQDGLRYI